MLDRYESEKAERLAVLRQRLERQRPDGGNRARFAEALYGHAAAEDLVAYLPDDLIWLAEDAWAAFAERPTGRHRIRFVDPPFEPNGRAVTVIEIVNDDMPFLLDSVMGELGDANAVVRLVAHPILSVERDAAGQLVAFHGPADAQSRSRESLITIHVDRLPAADDRAQLAAGLDRTLRDVRSAVEDWHAMRARARAVAAAWNEARLPVDPATLGEAQAFVEWLAGENFTFLGVREYVYRGDSSDGTLERSDEPGLGILRDPDVRVLRRGTDLVTTTQEIREFLLRPDPIIITKANLRSRVHRRSHMDYVGVKRFSADGTLAGEVRIVGLFTHDAYTRSVTTIPLVRRKVETVLARGGFDPASHSGKALTNILESYPRDEMFQLEVDTLAAHAFAILELGERPRIRVLARRDEFDRFVSVLVFIPRDRYSTKVDRRIGELLGARYDGRVAASSVTFPEGQLARLHVIVGRGAGARREPERETLEAEIASLVQTWSDELRRALAAMPDRQHARQLLERYAEAFSIGYRDSYPATDATEDIAVLERLAGERRVAINFYRRPEDALSRVSLKLFSRDSPIPLSDRVPVVEAMGFRVVNERTFRIEPAGERGLVYLHDMTLDRADGAAIDLQALDAPLEAMFMAVWFGFAESDGYNQLILSAGLGWRDIAMLRALSRYLRQVRIPYSQDYLWGALGRQPAIAAAIVELFHVRFGVDRSAETRAADEAAVKARAEAALEKVESLDDDRILRRFLNVVSACVRTNFFATGADGRPPETLAFKLDSHVVEDMPPPRPFREIWVYSPRVEGVHLRFGKVARGGLRWSDRPQDFRTEVLGLVKAQQVKNAVIVPVGAKGGFVPKRLPPPAAGREAWLAEGTEAYKVFVSTLLSLTDNLDGDTVVPPERVVRHDGDDPYLVVAADKGTATFSDTANAIALARGFWLGDAFASGGSAGYDHKKMGITARGAWEAVKRHFREIDVDIQTAPFTVAGVGDMSGDVFGNGMLLSPAIRLVAAFDHRDVFLDPDPDPATSLAERQRLFDLPRSSWQDYDKGLISEGGGVFSRTLKAIPLSPQVRALLGLDKPQATPAEVVSAILRAPVDLLWFGGIGTYVRASDESDADVGDRANDAVRIAAASLNARVIGEGANLGMTQRGRIEAARRGVRLNTDAIDNSAGVNTSDVEVNIKIALAQPVRDGRLDEPGRLALLAEMTDDVAALVLRNNYGQTLALSLAERRAVENLGFDHRLVRALEARGLLDRAVELLPDDAAFAELSGARAGLTRPELAVLIAYAKLTLFDDLVKSGVPDDPYLGAELFDYFPQAMRERFADAISGHRLRREIIATMMANALVNRGGPAFVLRLGDDTGADVATITAAFATAFDSYRMGELNAALDALDNRIPGALQLELYALLQEVLASRTAWFLRNVELARGLEDTIGRFRSGIDALAAALETVMPPAFLARRSQRAMELVQRGVPADLAQRLASLAALSLAPDAVLVAERAGVAIAAAAASLYALAERLRVDEIAYGARALPAADHFERLAIDQAVDRVTVAVREIAGAACRLGCGGAAVEAWFAANPQAARIEKAVAEITASGLSVAKLAVAASLLSDLAAGGERAAA
jgi:glutamate dehydrogenase